MARRTDSRMRMVRSAIGLIQRDGTAAMTVDTVLADSGAPRGSVYYHFPGGRDQIVVEALRTAGDVMTSVVVEAAETSPLAAIDASFEFWSLLLTDSDFMAGCPVVGAVASGPTQDSAIAESVESIVAGWHEALTTSLTKSGAPKSRADSLASMIMAAFEGAIILSRVRKSLTPLTEVVGEVRGLVASTIGQ